MLDTLIGAVLAADQDDAVAIVILTGAGRAFSAGADISRGTTEPSPRQVIARARRMGALFRALSESTKPLVAAVHGYALGGGCSLVMSCDLAVAADNAMFGYPELKAGLAATAVAPALVQQIGRKAAFELLSLCENVNAERALALGMINRVVPRDALLSEARRISEQLACFNHDALWMTKRTIQRAASLSPAAAVEMAGDASLVMRLHAQRGGSLPEHRARGGRAPVDAGGTIAAGAHDRRATSFVEKKEYEVMARTGLVLQGGGALGAFEYGALRRLYEEPAFSPDVISGVSIGAINAACLAGAKDDPRKTLELVWDRFIVRAPWFVPPEAQRFLSLFGSPSFFNARYDYMTCASWTCFYWTDPLRRLLQDVLDFDKLNNGPINLLVSATNVRTGDIEVFDNRTTKITAEHIVASGSLPPGFPMTSIGNECYWDGGLFNNTPLSPVIERLDPSPDVERRIYVINLFPNAGKVPANMLDVMDRMFEMIFSNKLVKNVQMTQMIDEFIQALDEIEASLPAKAKERVTKLPGYQRLRRYKAINNLIVIANEEPELVFGPFDFSRQTIAARMEAGYQAAARRLSGPAATAA